MLLGKNWQSISGSIHNKKRQKTRERRKLMREAEEARKMAKAMEKVNSQMKKEKDELERVY